jgi:hypothetical protein
MGPQNGGRKLRYFKKAILKYFFSKKISRQDKLFLENAGDFFKK